MNTFDRLTDLIGDFDTAMLVTSRPNQALEARPMAIAECDQDGALWFVTNRSSGKMTDIHADGHAAVTMQGRNKFVSLSGNIHSHDDRQKIYDLWQESWKVWFPKGKDDPSIVLLHFVPDHGDYWDNSGMQGAKYILKAGKAYLQGDTPTSSQDEHARVNF